MADPRIADDYSYIAQRMKEIEEERNPTPVSSMRPLEFECLRCQDKGWRYHISLGKWLRCGNCANAYGKPRPEGIMT